MAERRTRDDWQALAREHKRSSLGVSEFARARGIRPRTFAWWLWKLGTDRASPKKRGPARRQAVRMLPVSVLTRSTPEPGARLELAVGELSLRFTAETDPSYIAALVRRLQGPGC